MITTLFSILFVLAVIGTVFTLTFGLRARMQSQTIDEDRLQLASSRLTLEELELNRPFTERVARPAIASLLEYLGRLAPSRNLEQIQKKLELAGRPNGWTAVHFTGLRLASAVVVFAIVFVLLLLFSEMSTLSWLLLGAAGLLGFYLPLLWLSRRIQQRKMAILYALPDSLDMLNICVGAGLGFDAALSQVGERWHSPLTDEFNRVVAEMRLGKSRREALLSMVDRTEVPDVENFVATIVQADQLGVSIAKVLRTQAEQMRMKRRQRAEELARQAAIKMLFPLVLLIFPAMLAVLLGPAIPQLINTLGNLGG